jgi:hypothetical protein
LRDVAVRLNAIDDGLLEETVFQEIHAGPVGVRIAGTTKRSRKESPIA